jgi:hypothetical protein
VQIITCTLDPSVGGSGPHGFAIRTRFARLAKQMRPSHPASYVRDDRDTPLLMEAGRRTISMMLTSDKANYFCGCGLTGFASVGATGKSPDVSY